MKRSISLPIAQPAALHTDPVCGMKVDPATAAAEYEYNGTKYYFCAVRCKERFAADPESVLART
jgi:Cu+-exporting ATPase